MESPEFGWIISAVLNIVFYLYIILFKREKLKSWPGIYLFGMYCALLISIIFIVWTIIYLASKLL